MTGQNPKDASSSIIENNNFEIGRDVAIPQGIAVVEKANVTGYQKRRQ
jgi:hypothetical protein